MPRKITKKETGVYEKEPGSGVWRIRFKSNGVTRREKIGRRGDAIAAYKDRKTSILRGEKLPATMKNRGIRLREIGRDAIGWYIRTGKKDLRTFSQRMTALMDSPSERRERMTSLTRISTVGSTDMTVGHPPLAIATRRLSAAPTL